MKVVLYILAALVVVFVGFAIYVRVAPIDAASAHVDPATADLPGSANYARILGENVQATPEEVAARLTALAEAVGATLLAGDPADGHVTYVVRTRLMQFPDLVTLQWRTDGDATRLDVFSRAIYGKLDMGVNAARVQHWLQALRAD